MELGTRALVVTVVVGALLQPVVIRLMTHGAVIDIPNDRSSHSIPTPRGGGLAVVIAATCGFAILPGDAMKLIVPLVGMAILGFTDDVRGVPVRVRLAGQLAIGVITGVILVGAGRSLAVSAVLVLAMAVWLTGYVNAFNFMDGVNAIAAAHTVVGGLAFAAIGVVGGLPVLTGVGPVIAAAAVTFLPWNAGRARIFLGDVGSYGLGGALGAAAAYAVLNGVPVEAAVAPLALYLTDTGWTLWRRIRAGEVWYRAHRWHVYQRLGDVGWSHSQVAFSTATLAAVLSGCGLISLSGWHASRIIADLVAVSMLALYVNAPGRLASRPRLEVTP